MLEIHAGAVVVTSTMIESVIDELVTALTAVIHVRARDVAFKIDAATAGAMTQAEYNEVTKVAEQHLHRRRVAHYAAVYNLV